MRTAVVLPAPLWPSRPSTVPGSTLEVEPAQRLGVAEALPGPGEDRSRSYAVRHGTAYDSGTLYEMSSDPQAADLGPPRAARPRPAGRALARRDRRDVALDIADAEGLDGGLDPADRARAALRRDVALPLLRHPRRAAGPDGRRRSRGRCSCPSCRPTGATALQAIAHHSARHVPRAPVAADDAAGPPARDPEHAAPHRAVGARRSSPLGRARASRRSCSSGIVIAVDDYTVGFTLRELARGRPEAHGEGVTARFATPSTSPTSATCSRAASSRCSRSSSAQGGRAAGARASSTGLDWLLDGFAATAAPITCCIAAWRSSSPRRSAASPSTRPPRATLRRAGRQARLQRVALPADPGGHRGGHKVLTGLNRYPDPTNAALRARLSDVHGVPAQRIAIGNGSCDILLAAGDALLEPGAELVYAWPSFSVYPHLAAASGARAIEVPLDDATSTSSTRWPRRSPPPRGW